MNPFLIVGALFASIISFGLMSLGLMVIGRMIALSLQRARERTQVPPELKKAQAVARFVPTEEDADEEEETDIEAVRANLIAARRERSKLQSVQGKK